MHIKIHTSQVGGAKQDSTTFCWALYNLSFSSHLGRAQIIKHFFKSKSNSGFFLTAFLVITWRQVQQKANAKSLGIPSPQSSHRRVVLMHMEIKFQFQSSRSLQDPQGIISMLPFDIPQPWMKPYGQLGGGPGWRTAAYFLNTAAPSNLRRQLRSPINIPPPPPHRRHQMLISIASYHRARQLSR